MALKIRLARGGAKHRPFYRLVVAENTSPRDGKFVEKLGFYNPLVSKDNAGYFSVNEDRAKYWLSVGAKPSERVLKLLAFKNICEKPVIRETPKKSTPKKKAQERLAKRQPAAEASANA